MPDYETAIKRPFTDLTKLVIGIVLQIIPIVNFISFGYQLNCAKTAMSKKYELPEWEDFVGLFVKGLKAVVIAIVYFIPATIVMVVVGATILSSIMAGAMSGQVDSSLIMGAFMGAGIGLLIAGLLTLLTIYVLPSAILSFVSKESFGGAFSFGDVFKKAFKVKYLVVWIVAAIYSLIVGGILMLIPFIGYGIGGFITGVTAMTLLGEVYPEL